MKKEIRKVFGIFAILFSIVIAVNEFSRMGKNGERFTMYGLKGINSNRAIADKCSWVCHFKTNHCRENHVKFLKDYFPITDKLYMGEIHLLGKFKIIKNDSQIFSNGLNQLGVSTEYANYGLANIVFLVLLIPFLILYCLVKGLTIQKQIKKLCRK
jgi:hypothetical protein